MKITKLLNLKQYKSTPRVPKTPLVIADYELYEEANAIIRGLKKKLSRRNILIAALVPTVGAMAWYIKEKLSTVQVFADTTDLNDNDEAIE